MSKQPFDRRRGASLLEVRPRKHARTEATDAGVLQLPRDVRTGRTYAGSVPQVHRGGQAVFVLPSPVLAKVKKKFAFHVYIYTAIYSFPPSPYIRFYRFNKGWFEGVCEKCSRMLFSMRKEFLNVDVYEIIEKRVQSHYFRSYFRAHYERNPHYYDSVLMHV